MKNRRMLILVGSLLVALAAGVSSYLYVGRLEENATKDQELASVLVVSREIPRGTAADEALSNGAITAEKRRRVDLPADAVSTAADVQGQLAAIDLAPNDIVTRSKFVTDADISISNTSNIDKGNVAIAVSTDKVRGVSGLVEPGDFVNVMVTVPRGSPLEANGGQIPLDQARQAYPSNYVMTLYQKVRVLSVENNLGTSVASKEPGQTGEAETQASVLVLEVPQAAAALIAAGERSEGGLYLSLVRPDYEPVPIDPPNGGTLPGDLGLTPYPEVPQGVVPESDSGASGAASTDG